jgi:putative ABC transport system substrate-binding protein
MRRRDFIPLLGSAAAMPMLLSPRVGCAQHAMPVVGFLNGASAEQYALSAAGFRQGLSEVGYVEGRNVAIEYRWAENDYDRLPGLAADLVRRQVAVIAANTPAALPAKAATTTIPIVFLTAADPVEAGLVASLNPPGGNLTGFSVLNVELGPKRLELLREMVPTLSVVALQINPTHPATETLSRDLQAAARTLGLQLHILHASTERDFDTVFATLAQLRISALVIGPDPFFISRSEQLAALAVRHAMPTIFQERPFVAAGGLMSYGSSGKEAYRQLGIYTGRILKGDKPAELPVQQVTKVELYINLKTAKALGITVPLPLSGRADELFE